MCNVVHILFVCSQNNSSFLCVDVLRVQYGHSFILKHGRNAQQRDNGLRGKQLGVALARLRRENVNCLSGRSQYCRSLGVVSPRRYCTRRHGRWRRCIRVSPTVVLKFSSEKHTAPSSLPVPARHVRETCRDTALNFAAARTGVVINRRLELFWQHVIPSLSSPCCCHELPRIFFYQRLPLHRDSPVMNDLIIVFGMWWKCHQWIMSIFIAVPITVNYCHF